MGALGGRSLNSGHAATRAREIQGSGVREHSTLEVCQTAAAAGLELQG